MKQFTSYARDAVIAVHHPVHELWLLVERTLKNRLLNVMLHMNYTLCVMLHKTSTLCVMLHKTSCTRHTSPVSARELNY
jgi:hypothetical protein